MASRFVINEINRALSASATKTLLQLVAGANVKPVITELGISFDSTTSSLAPVRVEVLRQTTAGTASAFTPLECDPDGPACQSTAQVNATVEPTASDIVRSWNVTPVGGLWVVQFPLGREIVVPASARLGVRVITASAVTPNATAYLEFEE